MKFRILPLDVFGIGPNTTAFGVLKPDIWLRQNATIPAYDGLRLTLERADQAGRVRSLARKRALDFRAGDPDRVDMSMTDHAMIGVQFEQPA